MRQPKCQALTPCVCAGVCAPAIYSGLRVRFSVSIREGEFLAFSKYKVGGHEAVGGNTVCTVSLFVWLSSTTP